MSNEPPKPVSVKFSSVIHLTVDNYYLRGFGLISISVSLRQVFPLAWYKRACVSVLFFRAVSTQTMYSIPSLDQLRPCRFMR